jgi:hypothetical protein
MTGYSAKDIFSAAEIYDLSDLVKGGPSGDANTPLMALADQANYVRNRLQRWEGVKGITDNYTIDPVADLRQLFFVQINDNKTLVLPDAGSFPAGTRIPIVAAISGIKSLTVQSQNGQRILDGSLSWTKWDSGQPGIYLHDAEKLILVSVLDHWIVENAVGNFYSYGETFGSHVQRGNTLIAQGSIYNRADVPRLALLVNGGGPAVVSDGVWLSDPGGRPVYRGCYSSGNGGSTIRIPDLRGVSERYLDLGRGIDYYRLYNQPGGFEEEQVGTHDHATHGKGPIYGGGTYWYLSISSGRYSGSGGDPFGGKQGSPDTNMRTSDNNGSQNIVKNIGKIPLVRI